MTLHLWSHWFWITSFVVASLTLNVISDTIHDSSQEDTSPRLEGFGRFHSELSRKNLEVPADQNFVTVSPADKSPNLPTNPEANQSQADVREAKSIANHNMRLAVPDSSELPPTHAKAWSEPSSTEVIATDSNDSYLIDETSNISASTHIVPDRNTVAYSIDLSNSTEASHPLSPDSSTTPSGQLITISKININKVHKNKIPDDKIFKKNVTNSINGITLKKILASNKTKQQVQVNTSAVALNVSQLNTSEFKEVDHTAYQNDSPSLVAEHNKTAGQQNKTAELAHSSNDIPVKNETDEDTLFNSSEVSFNSSSAENTSFSTLNERIVAPDDGTLSSFNIIVIAVISATVVALTGLIGAVSFVMYRRYRWNKPQTLSDKCSNADSSGYIDDSTLRENSEEMYSLDNDSFLNSLEAMTIQNYWTDVKHTKL